MTGISTGDFEEAVAAQLGNGAPGLSASAITRRKDMWADAHARWRTRDLATNRYVYIWADGIYPHA